MLKGIYMSKKRIAIQISIVACLIAATVWFLFSGNDIDEIINIIASSRKVYFIVAIAAMGIYIYCAGWCVKVPLEQIGQSISPFRCIKYAFVEYYFSAITPSNTGGQPMQLVEMTRDGYESSSCTAAMLMSTIAYKLSLVVFTAIYFILRWRFAIEASEQVSFFFVLGVIIHIVFIMFLMFLLFSEKIMFNLILLGIKLLANLRIMKNPEAMEKRAEGYVKRYAACAEYIKSHPAVSIKTTLVAFLQRICILSVPVFVCLAIDGDTAALGVLDIVDVFGMQLIVSIASDMMPLPGGIGLNEISFSLVYKPFFEKLLATAGTVVSTTAVSSAVSSTVLMSRGISFYLMFVLSAVIVNGTYLKRIFKNLKEKRGKNK